VSGPGRPVVVLGASGSIGRQALDVAGRLGLVVVGLAARSPSEPLLGAAVRHPEARVAVSGGSSEERAHLVERLGGRVAFGSEAVVELAGVAGSTVVNGIVGAAGLRATMRALESGNRLALANKESLVAAGPLVLAARDRGGGELIPVDSEHSALFQLLAGRPAATVRRLILTASGGPFRGRPLAALEDVTPQQALRHPTWDMGPRITVDSATLANKGLEVIEAQQLFGVGFDQIEVLVHPQSVVHSLVELADGALLAHLGYADMRIPIRYALTHPERLDSGLTPFPLAGTTLEFEEPDLATFPMLPLAYAAGRQGGSAPAVFNAADEVAVRAFLDGRLGFVGIHEVVERTLAGFPHRSPVDVDDVLEVDREAREMAASLLSGAC
jgi:1-deoxy-D-xylulose-5-phosphate reductoisomerase